MQWTNEQQQVISARGCNLIVSAAAGSGKTAVLVERICSLVVDEGADVGRMLVATFTRAAAAEMKSRIAGRLARAAEDPAIGRRVSDQLMKLDRAAIGTLHSFCGELLRQYYNSAGIEPTFRTEDEAVTRGLHAEALDAAIDGSFEEGGAAFLELAACWGGRGGEGLHDLVGKIYGFARNHPDPMAWLKDKVDRFDFQDAELTPWYAELKMRVGEDLTLAHEAICEAVRVASLPNGPRVYLSTFQEEMSRIRDLCHLYDTDDMAGLAAAASVSGFFSRLPSFRGADGAALAQYAKDQREEAKRLVRNASGNPVLSGLNQAAARTRAMLPQMRALYALVEEFDRRYAAEKRYANVLDFSDLEHLALAVLADAGVCEEVRAAYDWVFVDEYQDISPIQDALLRRVSRPGRFFCVGDVKQSIYRFRSAEPEIFVRRLAASSCDPASAERRIGLNSNFRSTGRVVGLANFLFENLMSRLLGGVEYAQGEALVQGAPQPDSPVPGCVNEFLLIDNEGKKEEELTRLEELVQIQREATVAAGRIRNLIGRPLWDGKLGNYRETRYSDVVVLLRTVSGVASEYAEVLRRAGVPVYAEAEGGFAGELEVELLLCLLRLIDNPLRDYELITAMHAPFGGFSLEDLVEIRGLCREGSFAGAVQKYLEENNTELSGRIDAFFRRLGLWRSFAMHADVEKLVYRICDDTGFHSYAGTLPQGERRQANIETMARLGRGYAGRLYDFVRDFPALVENVRGRPAGQSDGSVTLMSVHKSKGLEFPIVLLANVGKAMNLTDAGDNMPVHGELGLGPRYYNAERRTRADTLAREALCGRIRQDSLSEEMRMLYVAVTRARERLIVLGTVQNLTKSLRRWAMPLSPAGLSHRGKSWADWLGPAALRTPSGQVAFAPYGVQPEPLPGAPCDWAVSVLPAAQIKALRPEPADRAAAVRKLLREAETAVVPEETAAALAWQYPWGDVSALPSKVSATSLLDRDRNWRGPIPAPEIRRTPRFLEERKAFGATELGTFAHTALQLLGVDTQPDKVPEAVAEFERRGLLPEGASSAIDLTWIQRFLRSGIAGRIRKSPQVQRELPFNLAVPAHVVFPGETGDEDILVQGIIDCCFMEDGRWVVVDYKTNRVDGRHTPEAIAAHYKPQLQTYRTALEEITGIEVKEAWLYLLAVGAEVRVVL